MFHFADGLMLNGAGLAVDVRRRQPRGFISHAHADHMAPHVLAFCTPQTACLYQHRLGPRPTIEMPYGEAQTLGSLQLTTLPAGHVLGAAMLLADDGRQTLLYTGDFRLLPSATSATPQLPAADFLVMETTFGTPDFRFPPRSEVLERLLEIVRDAQRQNRTPVLHAYVLGKAQEVTHALCAAGFHVRQHPLVHEISLLYEQLGCRLGSYSRYDGPSSDDPPACHDVLVFPPPSQRTRWIPLPPRRRTVALSGWAMRADYRHRVGVDFALPWSDHADYDELLQCARQVAPRRIYCTHGPRSFVDCLRQAGHDAHWLQDARTGPGVA